MRAMVLESIGSPLQLKEVAVPSPGSGELLIEVSTCGICRTDLHVKEGELMSPHLPLIMGHQVVGRVVKLGQGVKEFRVGERVGVPWLGDCCGACRFCLTGRENLCDHAVYTGYQKNGGFAEFCVAKERFCFRIPKQYDDQSAAPLLCAGMIGYRALRFTGAAKRLGLYGFGSSAHLIIQLACRQKREVFVFTRGQDKQAMQLARELGAKWVGSSDQLPPQPLDAAIIFAPVGSLVLQALKAVDKGAAVICAGIHMSDIPSFPYQLIWEERSIHSVCNLTVQDGRDLLSAAEEASLQVKVHSYPLERANEALEDLKEGRFSGSAVLTIQ